MKVIFFGETPHRLGGAQRSLLAQLSRIRENGIEPLAVFPAEGRCTETYRDAGIPVLVLPGPPVLTVFDKQVNRYGLLRRASVVVRELVPYSQKLATLARREGAGVLHFNSVRGILEAGLAGKLSGRPTVLHVRGAVDQFSLPLWGAAQALARRIVFVARSIAEDVSPPFRSRARVVYNGVDVPPGVDAAEARRRLYERFGWPADDLPVFLSLSSLVPFKGLHHLVDAAAELSRRGRRARFVLAGWGEPRYEEWLRARIARLGTERSIELCGFVSDPLELMRGADALVLSTIDYERLDMDGTTVEAFCAEGLPRAILEAMALGKPVVATHIEGVPEQVENGVSGIIVPPRNATALADGCERIATDPAWARAAGVRGREIASQRFTVQAASAALANVLREAAAL